MIPKTLIGQRQRRDATFMQPPGRAAIVDPDSRTVALSFSSEAPVDRWFGREILSHAPGSADFSRLNDGANLLFNHDMNDVIGVVENARIGPDRRGRATVRFAKTPRADEVVGMVNDRILRNVSFMYDVQQMVDDPDGDDDAPGGNDPGMNTYTATKWRAYEISIVSVPADASVGVGRSLTKGRNMDDQNFPESVPGSRAERIRAASFSSGETAGRESGVMEERDRVAAITEMGRRFNAEAVTQRAIRNGHSVETARLAVLELVESRDKQQPVAAAMTGGADLGLNDRELRGYSICKAVMAQATNDWRNAGFERECSNATGKKLGRESPGVFVPLDIQARWNLPAMQVRAPYAVGAAGTGGNIVETELLASSFIEVLRNTAMVLRSGATVLSGLVGKVAIPSQSTATATYWVGESGAITEAEATFGQITLSPKTLGALSKMSRLTLLQTTPAIEMLVRNDMARVMGLGIDLAALSGSGASNQPTGIVNTSGIGSVVGGTNGLQVTLDHLLQLEETLATSNAPNVSRGYILNSKTVSTLKQQKATTGSYIWTLDSATNPGQRSATPPTFSGYPVFASNQVRSNLTKGTSSGVCSELFFADWSELIVGEWGVLEILVNPFDSTGFTTGDVLIRSMQTIDIQVRHAASFAYMADGLTI